MNEKERNERPQNRTDAKPCLSDVYKMSTRAKRRKADATFPGEVWLKCSVFLQLSVSYRSAP